MLTRTMKNRPLLQTVGLAAGLALGLVASAAHAANGTSFTYQGLLENAGTKVTVSTSIEFRLFDAATGGSQVGPTIGQSVTPDEGVFSADLDFGLNAFASNTPLFLEITVDGQTLSRQRLENAPFALNTRGVAVDDNGDVSLGTNGRIGVNTALSIIEPGIVTDDSTVGGKDSIAIAAEDAIVTLLSPNTGSFGSWIGLKDIDATTGLLNDQWSLNRQTTDFGSDLRVKYGSFADGNNNPTQVAITELGDVGLGTETPEDGLHIADTNPRILLEGQSGSSFAGMRQRLDGQEYFVGIDGFTSTPIWSVFDNTAGAVRLAITPTGDVGVGTNDPAATLDVAGDAEVDTQMNIRGTFSSNVLVGTSGTNANRGRVWVCDELGNCGTFIDWDPDGTAFVQTDVYRQNSDRRLKTDIQDIDAPLDTVRALRGVTYAWKDRDTSEQIGFIAQEVEAVLPQLVSDGENGYKSVSYANLTAVLVEAVKEQQKQIDSLEAKLDSGSGAFHTTLAWPVVIGAALFGGFAIARRRNTSK